MKIFPSENQSILEPSIADYILLGFIFSITSGLTAFFIGNEDISVFLSVFMAQAFTYWGLIGLIEYKEGKIKKKVKINKRKPIIKKIIILFLVLILVICSLSLLFIKIPEPISNKLVFNSNIFKPDNSVNIFIGKINRINNTDYFNYTQYLNNFILGE